MATTFTRMDESTAEEWAVIGTETIKNQPRVAEQFLTMLRQCADITDGFATRAFRCRSMIVPLSVTFTRSFGLRPGWRESSTHSRDSAIE